jgi:hypothetical protein
VLAAETPDEVEAAVEASLNSALSSRLSWRLTSDYERINPRIDTIDEVSDVDLLDGLAVVLGALVPAKPRVIVAALTKCDTVTKARAANETDGRARMAVFVEDLREFPPDVVVDAFRGWRRTETFTPTVSDIRDRCWQGMRLRGGLRSLLSREAAKRGLGG